jgi:uncharacterized membrane protein (UPF0182 family)
VPLGGGLLSVEPIYVSASSVTNSGSYPQLKKVLTYFNGQVGFGNTLVASLAQVFGNAGPTAPTGPSGGHVNAAVLGFLAEAERDYVAAQAALHDNPPNFTLYGQEIAKMKAALDSAQQAANPSKSGKGSGGSPSPSTSPSPPGKPSPSPSPSS